MSPIGIPDGIDGLGALSSFAFLYPSINDMKTLLDLASRSPPAFTIVCCEGIQGKRNPVNVE